MCILDSDGHVDDIGAVLFTYDDDDGICEMLLLGY